VQVRLGVQVPAEAFVVEVPGQDGLAAEPGDGGQRGVDIGDLDGDDRLAPCAALLTSL
jgi:hypothetical protein